jgi:o-succinylbenzoate synthase
MYKYEIEEKTLHFKQPAGTSRGVYTTRKIWLVRLSDGEREGVGECAPLPDLSCDAMDDDEYGKILNKVCEEFCQRQESQRGQPLMCSANSAHEGQSPCDSFEALRLYPSMLFGLETAYLSLQSNLSPLTSHLSPLLFDTAFSRGEVGIPINGLVWMGSYEEMLKRMEEKLEKGFRCVKLKIGAIDFDQELDLVKRIRERFSHHEVELRLDANGAFKYDEALYKLELLSQYAIHSIEQPIKAGQWAYMAELCRESPLPIALDEELIGVNDPEMKRHMLNIIKPRYIILKPSLHGGMQGCREWIETARDMGIGSWITSALESNIGLNAIAQFASDVYGDHITMPQGLGTGQLFTDNIDMGLEIRGDMLFIDRRTFLDIRT